MPRDTEYHGHGTVTGRLPTRGADAAQASQEDLSIARGYEGLRRLMILLRKPFPPRFEWDYTTISRKIAAPFLVPTSDAPCGTAGCAIGLMQKVWNTTYSGMNYADYSDGRVAALMPIHNIYVEGRLVFLHDFFEIDLRLVSMLFFQPYWHLGLPYEVEDVFRVQEKMRQVTPADVANSIEFFLEQVGYIKCAPDLKTADFAEIEKRILASMDETTFVPGLEGLRRLSRLLRKEMPSGFHWDYTDIGYSIDSRHPDTIPPYIAKDACGTAGCAIGLAGYMWKTFPRMRAGRHPTNIIVNTAVVADAFEIDYRMADALFFDETFHGHLSMFNVLPTDVADSIDFFLEEIGYLPRGPRITGVPGTALLTEELT